MRFIDMDDHSCPKCKLEPFSVCDTVTGKWSVSCIGCGLRTGEWFRLSDAKAEWDQLVTGGGNG